ncbi:MAG TPA: NUDIX domain-containing protein [Blastocatellia bacterium]|nr:NUDIX domain-containing protein [Blastocatellia bacterium]
MEKHLTVSAIIIDGSKILLVKHKKLDLWLYPGGHLEKFEDPIQGLKREIEEEVGQEIKILSVPSSPLTGSGVEFLPLPFAILSEKIAAGTEKEHIHIDLIYLCRAFQSTVSPNLKETDGANWFSLEEIRSLRVPDEFPALIEAGMEAASHLSLLNDEGNADSSPVKLSVALLVRRQDSALLFGDSEGGWGLPVRAISSDQSPDEIAEHLIDLWLSGSMTLNGHQDERFYSNDVAPLRLPVAIACFPDAGGRECVLIYETVSPNESHPSTLDRPQHKWLPLSELAINPSIFKVQG